MELLQDNHDKHVFECFDHSLLWIVFGLWSAMDFSKTKLIAGEP